MTCHRILHDLNTVIILEGYPCHFIKCHHAPQTHQSNRAIGEIVEKVGNGRFAAGNKDAIGFGLIQTEDIDTFGKKPRITRMIQKRLKQV